MMGKLLASMASRGAGQFRQAASGRHPSLDIAGTAHRLDPQLGRRPVMRSVLQLAFLEHDLDGTGERFHRNLQCAGQPRLVVYRGEGLPKHLGIVDQAISGVHRLLQIEARKRPVGAAREIGLAITDQAGGDIGGIANAMECEFVDHQARHNLGLAAHCMAILMASRSCWPTRIVNSLICNRSRWSCTSRSHSYSLSSYRCASSQNRMTVPPPFLAQASLILLMSRMRLVGFDPWSGSG